MRRYNTLYEHGAADVDITMQDMSLGISLSAIGTFSKCETINNKNYCTGFSVPSEGSEGESKGERRRERRERAKIKCNRTYFLKSIAGLL